MRTLSQGEDICLFLACGHTVWMCSFMRVITFVYHEGEPQKTLPGFLSNCVRCFVCFVLGPCTMTGPKTNHTKHLTQVDGNSGTALMCSACADICLLQ